MEKRSENQLKYRVYKNKEGDVNILERITPKEFQDMVVPYITLPHEDSLLILVVLLRKESNDLYNSLA